MAEQASFEQLRPPVSLRLGDPVWGIDPSTLRVSVGILEPRALAAPTLSWRTCSLPRKSPDPARWFAGALGVLVPFFRGLVDAYGVPILVDVEEPFAGGKTRVHPSSNRMIGVILAALGHVLGAQAESRLVQPNVWKSRGLGQGFGTCTPAVYTAWARDVAGYTGELEDEAAAIGIATAAGVELEARARRAA